MRNFLRLLCLGTLFFARSVVAADKETLREVYTLLPEYSLNPLTVEDVVVPLLKGITSVDKNLVVGNDGKRVSLYYKGKLLKSFYKPQKNDDVEAWVKLSGALFDEAEENSDKAAQHDFELADLSLAAMADKIGGGVRLYLSSDEMKEGRIKHRRFFAARKEGKALYLKLAAMNAATVDDVKTALQENSDAEGMILDMRGNPGGSFDAAIKVADLFLDRAIIASTKGRKSEDAVYYNAEAGDLLNGKPIIVLIDGETASAAEILAAALQEQGRATLVGTRTFGKASVQQLFNLPGGSVLSVTRAFYYTPSGILIEGRGVIPDICTFEMPESKSVEKLLSSGVADRCLQEVRADEGLDLDVAKELIERQIRQKM